MTHDDKEIVRGKIVRNGYVTHANAYSYGQTYCQGKMAYAITKDGSEVDLGTGL